VPSSGGAAQATVVEFSTQNTTTSGPDQVLDFYSTTRWNTSVGHITNQFVKFRLEGTAEPLIDRVRLQNMVENQVVKDFEVQVATSENDADLVTVFTGTYQNNGQLQEFVFPGGPVRARYVKLIAKNNYGDPNYLY